MHVYQFEGPGSMDNGRVPDRPDPTPEPREQRHWCDLHERVYTASRPCAPCATDWLLETPHGPRLLFVRWLVQAGRING